MKRLSILLLSALLCAFTAEAQTAKDSLTDRDTVKSVSDPSWRNVDIKQLSNDLHEILSIVGSMFRPKHEAEYREGMNALKNGDEATAEALFLQAAEKGNTAAMYELGNLYFQSPKGFEWMKKAANGGNIDAMLYWGEYIYFMKDPDFDKALHWLTKAADKGDVSAMLSLGHLYCTEIPPLIHGRDYTKAREWYAKAAEKGDAMAAEELRKIDKILNKK